MASRVFPTRLAPQAMALMREGMEHRPPQRPENLDSCHLRLRVLSMPMLTRGKVTTNMMWGTATGWRLPQLLLAMTTLPSHRIALPKGVDSVTLVASSVATSAEAEASILAAGVRWAVVATAWQAAGVAMAATEVKASAAT